MPKLRDFGGDPNRFAVLIRESGIVSGIHTMHTGSAPWIDKSMDATHEIVRGVPGYVSVGMVLKGDEFDFPDDTWQQRSGVHPGRQAA